MSVDLPTLGRPATATGLHVYYIGLGQVGPYQVRTEVLRHDDTEALIRCALVDTGADVQIPHDKWFFYLARICNHCTYPGCLASCPRTSIYKRPEDGIVLVDQERCRGYQECVKACPYKKVFFNSVTGTSEKCIGALFLSWMYRTMAVAASASASCFIVRG